MGVRRMHLFSLLIAGILGLSCAVTHAADTKDRVISPEDDYQDAQYFLPYQGFKNIVENGRAVGFQIRVKSGYYRGVYVNLLENFEVTVDGETFLRDQIKFSLRGKTYSLDELEKHTDTRWQWDDFATLIVSKPGGLQPGMHNVEVIEELRISYMPTIPTPMRFKRQMPLVY